MTQAKYEFIVVGAGSAGCALAARLAAGGRSVLLLEAGDDDRWIWIRIPAGVAYILRGERGLRRFHTESEAQMNGRSIFWPRGKVVGGSSSVNGMIWVHGDPCEYDRWRDEFGAQGWGYDDLKPIFRDIEGYAGGDPAIRGRRGPVSVTEFRSRHPLMNAFIDACVTAGIPRNPDYNGASYEGVGYLQHNIRKGWRWSSREAFLRPLAANTNLRLQTGALVSKIVFDGKRASGVQYQLDGQRCEATATCEVILCAGAIQSPQILELSGIGRQGLLQDLGIPVLRDAPAVGENLQDHLHTRVTYECRNATTLNQIMRNPLRKAWMAADFALRGRGMMSCASAVAHALAKSDPALAQPDIKLQLHWLSSPDARDPKRLVLDDFPGFSIGTFPLRPTSRGSVHIKSREPGDAPVIQANYLSSDEDRRVTVAAIEMARKVAAQPALARFVVRETRPGAEQGSASGLLDYARTIGQTSYHPVGTCRMGDDDQAVVDASLRVKGVTSLRVADASIMPTLCSANTNAPSMMIGEKAARLIQAGN
ncbi:GMC oxidoreductase [Achromobacter sp. LC458]|uniref:GMC family oxidoreductase n=1 Tax=unclassified Achromobacter TaxID=2626865 RepID=UPI00062A0DA6|nr:MULTISPECIES: GMC family oxidoreductase N-terminal domain-containing protein [unclassified Achromobacter]AYD66490.1 GMC oxidoreductase [Achromobacter sp. B7]TRM53158.1 GMC oxidoreductase [Achromobacter sp. LC458]HCQ46835.1 GMC oxidoreductase [Achromobacter sp.]